jgi:hypothetical protein
MRFAELYSFGLDPFQVRACEALERVPDDRPAPIAAPEPIDVPGAGRTVVDDDAT